MSRLARIAVRRPMHVLAGWLGAILVLGLVGVGVEGTLLPTQLFVPGTQSDRARQIEQGHFGEEATVLLTGPAAQLDLQGPRLVHALLSRPHTNALSPWTSGPTAATELRPRPTEAMIPLDVGIAKGQNVSTIVPPLDRFIRARVHAPVVPHLSGLSVLGREINDAGIASLRRAELIAFPALILILLFVFRSPLAAAIPLVVAVCTVVFGFGVIAVIAERAKLDAVALNMASMVGLALGVDYSLLIVTRFREALAQGLSVPQSASLAAHTAGRTAVFAGSVLVGIMLVALLLSPGSVLLSAAVGAIVVTLMSMLGAALVTPAVLRLVGRRVNVWQFGRRQGEADRFGQAVGRVSSRPALAIGLALPLVLALAAPVLALKTTPPDPRELPSGSSGLRDYLALRQAGFGPGIEVALKTDRGPLTDPARLDEIRGLESSIARMPRVRAVVGPGVLATEAGQLVSAPASLARGEREAAQGRVALANLERGLGRATNGVSQLRSGLDRAQSGAALLAAGGARAGFASGLIAGGSGAAAAGGRQLGAGADLTRQGLARLQDGLGRALDGARQLSSGAAQARNGSHTLANADARLAAGLPLAKAQLQGMLGPTQTAEVKLNEALSQLQQMQVGKQDPLYLSILQAVSAASGAISGHDPTSGPTGSGGYTGVPATLATMARQASQAVTGAQEISAGANRLYAGLQKIAGGNHQLLDGIQALYDGVRSSAPQLRRFSAGALTLAAGLTRLSGGALQLQAGLGRLAGGQQLLARGLYLGFRQSLPLQTGLASGHAQVRSATARLLAKGGALQQLHSLETVQSHSPGFFSSGYVTVAAIEGAPAVDRHTSQFILDSVDGASVGRVIVLPNSPPNDPRTVAVVGGIRRLTATFQKRTGIQAAVGGSAALLVDFSATMGTRLPLLVLGIALVTYLLLVPILRSLFLPMIAVALNLFTVAVGFGVLTLLFVGHHPSLGGPGKLDMVAVAGIFALTFALSIDYQVFLLTRMREEFVRTQSNDAAIAFGISKTAKVVTGAALIMIIVFLAFGVSNFVIVKQFGIGLAVAVAVDATLVRLVLLPSLMRLFGLSTWWLPTWLDERLPLLDTEGSEIENEFQFARPLLRARDTA